MEKLLSSAGKDVLIKSNVQAILVYSMAFFRLPRAICEHVNYIIRKFWWGSKKGERKAHCVSWETMTKPEYMVGLGFRDLGLFNLTLLARQTWRILQESISLSARMSKLVYFPESYILEAELGSHPSQIWHAILSGREVLKRA